MAYCYPCKFYAIVCSMFIGFIGNFIPPHSTENDRAWSLQILGHNIVKFQENAVTAQDILDNLSFDVLFYSHTHGWEIPNLEDVFAACKDRSIPTVSAHLDLWTNLEREVDIGKEATWKTDYIFTPDKTIKLPNHYYMRPGVKESSCYLAAPDPVLYSKYKVAFVGSYGYHKEYPERPQLIDFLKETYKDEFLHIEHSMRGHDLNVLYRSVPVIVGDSCFSQSNPIPGYYSDRIPETLGRGGLLFHPKNDHIDIPGLVNYTSLSDLEIKIDYFLQTPHEAEEKRLLGYNYVKNNDTYTQIMKEIMMLVS